MTLKAICNREVLIAQKNDTVVAAAKLMRDYHAAEQLKDLAELIGKQQNLEKKYR